MDNVYAATVLQKEIDPHVFVRWAGGIPLFDFKNVYEGGKFRNIGYPNKPMRLLQGWFAAFVKSHVAKMLHNHHDGYRLRKLQSSFAFVEGSNPIKHALRHSRGKFFYITDLTNAYGNVDLTRLALLLVYIVKYEIYMEEFGLSGLANNIPAVLLVEGDELYPKMLSFLRGYITGPHGEGVAIGGPSSPYLMNLYCEVFVDDLLRKLCKRMGGDHAITFTRYADDLVFSRERPLTRAIRKEIRDVLHRAGFTVNHKKSKVLSREMGTVFVTKVGLTDKGEPSARLTFPQNKRRHLQGMIRSYLAHQIDIPEIISGYIAEFIFHWKNVHVKTKSDRRTFKLCKLFEQEYAKYRTKKTIESNRTT